MKGEKLELQFSRKIHKLGVPLLISSQFLRSYGCGQCDISFMKKVRGKWEIHLFELKSSPYISHKQKQRLRRTLYFMSLLFPKTDVFLKFIFAKK